MQTTLNIPPAKLRRRQIAVRRVVLFVFLFVVGSFMTGQLHGQTNSLPSWTAPPVTPSPTSVSPSNQVLAPINLPSNSGADQADSNVPIALPTEPLTPLLAPVHVPIRPQSHVRTAAFEAGVHDFAKQSQQATDNSDATDNRVAASPVSTDGIAAMFNKQASEATSQEGLWASIKVGLLLAVLSLAPAIVLMTTCYVRVVVVLTLLRQAFGGQQLPPMQVITALSLFLTMLIMAPVWTEVKNEAIDPYTREQSPIGWEEAWQRGIEPVKHFMVSQIKASGNTDSVAVFYKHLPDAGTPPTTLEQVPINVLLPAFLISELKIAFLLGFQIFLPFLVLDLVVSSVTVSSGMMMLPPTMVSFPLKLILFVMVDGWNLVVGMLLQSFSLG